MANKHGFKNIQAWRERTPGYQDGMRNPGFKHGKHWSRKRRLAKAALLKRGVPLDVCERCRTKITTPKAVQFHHKNRDPWDNRPRNVEVLCVGCHAGEHTKDRNRDQYGRLVTKGKVLPPPLFAHRKRDANGRFC